MQCTSCGEAGRLDIRGHAHLLMMQTLHVDDNIRPWTEGCCHIHHIDEHMVSVARQPPAFCLKNPHQFCLGYATD